MKYFVKLSRRNQSMNALQRGLVEWLEMKDQRVIPNLGEFIDELTTMVNYKNSVSPEMEPLAIKRQTITPDSVMLTFSERWPCSVTLFIVREMER